MAITRDTINQVAVPSRAREKQEHRQPARRRGQDMEI